MRRIQFAEIWSAGACSRFFAGATPRQANMRKHGFRIQSGGMAAALQKVLSLKQHMGKAEIPSTFHTRSQIKLK
jgi:hypothetical protein